MVGVGDAQCCQVTPDESEGWGLGTITEDRHLTLSIELSEDEYERYQEAIASILARQGRFTFELVARNYQDLLNVEKYVEIIVAAGRAFG